MTARAEKSLVDFGFPDIGSGYEVNYCFGQQGPTGVVKDTSLAELFHRYADILWDDGHHKYNVKAFIGELDEILLGARFSAFSQDLLDNLIGALRKRGNSNATINRKMAALSKLLRKAYKMGEIHSLPEFRRQKERAGRLRFLEADEEEALFREIGIRSARDVEIERDQVCEANGEGVLSGKLFVERDADIFGIRPFHGRASRLSSRSDFPS